MITISLQKIKDWALMILLAVIGILVAIVTGKKSKWAKEKEKEVETRQKVIEKTKKKTKSKDQAYREIVQEHNEELKKAGEKIEKDKFDDTNDAVHYIDDILSGNSTE